MAKSRRFVPAGTEEPNVSQDVETTVDTTVETPVEETVETTVDTTVETPVEETVAEPESVVEPEVEAKPEVVEPKAEEPKKVVQQTVTDNSFAVIYAITNNKAKADKMKIDLIKRKISSRISIREADGKFYVESYRPTEKDANFALREAQGKGIRPVKKISIK